MLAEPVDSGARWMAFIAILFALANHLYMLWNFPPKGRVDEEENE